MISNSTRCIEVDRENEMMFIRRRQVSPREEEIDCEGENTEEEDEVVETVCEALANMRRTTRTGKTYSLRKKGQKKKRGVTEDEDEESKQSDENETPMRQVLRVTQYRSSSPNRDSLFSSPDNSPPRGSNKRPRKQSPMRRLRSAVGQSAVGSAQGDRNRYLPRENDCVR